MTLLLKSNDISPYSNNPPNNFLFTTIYSNDAGSMTNCRTNSTYNINLEELLGEEYKNNETFQIELLQYAYGNKDVNDTATFAGYQGFGVFNSNLCTKMSGLNFVNGQSSVLLGGFNFRVATLSNVLQDFQFNTAVFQKPNSPQIILSLQLFSTALNTVVPTEWIIGAGGSTYHPFIYLFRITPYTEEYLQLLSV